MDFGSLRRKVEMRRWEVEHPEFNEYNMHSGCCSPLAVCLVLVLLLCGCKAREVIIEKPVEVPHYVHDTLEVKVKETETVYVTDSMWIKGDTVYKFRDRWRELVVHDTLRSVVRDTVGIPVEVTKTEVKEVEKDLYWWQKGLMWLGGVSLALGVGWVVVKIKC